MPLRNTQSGFSMPEMLVAMLVLSFVMLGATTVYLSNQRAYERGQAQTETHQNARVGLEMLTRELRMAGFDPLDQISLQATPSVFQTATADTLTFLADVSADGTLDKITYRLQGDLLIREFSSWDGSGFPAAAIGEVAAGVSGFGLAYSDGTQPTNNAIPAPVTGTTLWDIRRITVTLQTVGRTVAGLETTYDLSIDVKPRNLS
jgi:prepilin-type N-terminal cleavage/methylation domain-containing protein